jgi:hypothetical protein
MQTTTWDSDWDIVEKPRNSRKTYPADMERKTRRTPMAISEKMQHFATKSSWIRKMFEEGARMKATFGAANVCDFSLGNPDVPPPRSCGKLSAT